MKNLYRQVRPYSRPRGVTHPGRAAHWQSGSGRIVLLVLVAFALGLGVATFLIPRGSGSRSAPNAGTPIQGTMSQHTSEALQRLEAPVEIRFYALLDPETVPASVRDFARRIDSLLSEYAAVAEGKLKIVRYLSSTEEAANAASADRIKPFNLDRGNACFLGVALSCQDRKESIPHLALEWEPALESDLTRAVLRVANPGAAAPKQVSPATPDAAVINQVRSLLPDLASVTVEQGTQVLREKSLAAFSDAVKEIQVRVQEAQQRLAQARNGGSAADQQAVLAALHKVQAEQADRLKQISAQLQEQIAALEFLKKN